ncbi:MAG: helix-turn-helix transcriptional regulator [Atopobiaceae bacterium]|nr:helix-turn-helix transcriptional regulator [Atopobiaceae bacterium]
MGKRRDLVVIVGNIVSRLGSMGKTMKWLSQETGIPKGSIYSYATASAEIPSTRLKKIADALGCTVDELMKGV